MTKPTAAVRRLVMDRDGRRCVAGFESGRMEFQHRQSDGMGGSIVKPTAVHGVAACNEHNTRFERDLQIKALVHGWKVRRWVREPGRVPVFYVQERSWCRLLVDGSRVFVSEVEAVALMHAVYGMDVYEGWRAQL